MASKAFNKCFNGLANVKSPQGAVLTADEIQRLQGAFTKAVQTARASGVPIQQAIMGAPKAAVKQLQKDIQLQQYRIAMKVMAAQNLQAAVARGQGQGLRFGEIFSRLMFWNADGKMKAGQAVNSRALGIAQDNLRILKPLFSKLQGMFGFFENKAAIASFIRGIDGLPTGNAEITKAVQAWKKVSEGIRDWVNKLGGDIGDLGDIYRPQKDDVSRLVKAGEQKWVDDLMGGLLDRTKYLDDLGSILPDADIRAILSKIFTTKITEGANKGLQEGTGFANRGSQHRELHLKQDGESWIKYHESYGGATILEMMEGHIHTMSNFIALLERFGPDPKGMIKQQFDNEIARLGGNAKGIQQAKDDSIKAFLYHDHLRGIRPEMTEGAQKVYKFFNKLWLLNTFKLGGSALTSFFTNFATLSMTARVNGMSGTMAVLSGLRHTLLPKSAAYKLQLENAGLLADTYNTFMAELSSDMSKKGLLEKVVNVHMLGSFLNHVDKMQRAAFGKMLMNNIGQMTRSKTFAQLDATDRQMITKNGATELDWEVWRQATPEKWSSASNMLTPESIYAIPDALISHLGDPAQIRKQAAASLLGVIYDEGLMASYTPREHIKRGLGVISKGGTTGSSAVLSGIAGSALQFKSFPIGFFVDHLKRGLSQDGAFNKTKYVAGIIAGMTLMGVFKNQVSALMKGKNPEPMFNEDGTPSAKVIAAGAATGGAFGIMGDYLFGEINAYGNTMLESAAGPTISAVFAEGKHVRRFVSDLIDRDADALGRFAAGTMQVGKGFVPGYSLLYLNAVLDHNIFQQLQEMANPGYLDRMRRRIKSERGQTSWWQPGERMPDQVPQLQEALGVHP